MATVNFNVPDELEKAFAEAFSGHDKDAVIAQLMTRAVEERARTAGRSELFRRLTQDRSKRPFVTAAELASARTLGRP